MQSRLLAVTGLALSLVTVRAEAQLRGVRFEITAVGDTTLSFNVGRERWLRRGERGIAVDPRKRDVLVARLQLLGVGADGVATAVITGQTTAITTDHVVIIQEPRPSWYRRKAFWGGLVAGLALGIVTGTRM